MPLTFIEIERQKSWRISLLLIILLFMYLGVTIALLQGLSLFFPGLFFKFRPVLSKDNWTHLLTILAFSLMMALIHFWFSASNAVRSVINNLNASPPDPEDGIHKRLMNIMEEIHIVSGNKRKMRCMIIPSLSMNALAVEDLSGDAVVAITEGLLSRLTRPQLESVIAHEAYHILSGDCMETTVCVSLFGIYASALEKLRNFGNGTYRGLHPAFFLFWILLKLSQLLNMFISREREYRADAASVRMTRNPSAMAEALYLLSRNWTGVGFVSSGIEMLCIVSPLANELDESEGWLADLLSTHPPLMKRIEILLTMAHIRTAPLTWLSSRHDQTIERTAENSFINTPSTNYRGQKWGGIAALTCPYCRQPLYTVPYEKTRVYMCNYCSGILVESDKVPRIIARGKACSERIQALARAVIADNQRNISKKKLKGAAAKPMSVFSCPKCGNPMFRTFYSLAYLIEIDRCNICRITWFERDEIEMLQCVIENKITARIGLEDVQDD